VESRVLDRQANRDHWPAGIGKTALVAEALARQRYVSVSVSAQIGRERPEPPRRASNGALQTSRSG